MRTPIRIAAIAALVVSAAAGIAHADTTVRVSGNTAAAENMPGWMFNRDPGTATPFEFNLAAASVGFGSLYVLPIANDANPGIVSHDGNKDKFIGELFLGTTVARTGTMSFDFKLGAGVDVSKASQFYWNVYANYATSSATKFYDCRYSVTAASGSAAMFTTVVFDPAVAAPVTTRTGSAICPEKLAEMGPNAVVRAAVINVGDTSASDAGVGGYLDRVVVNVDGSATTYDFDVPLQVKDQCKSGGWEAFGFANQGDCVSSLQAATNAGK